MQSAALRIICDREEEIAAFIPQEYWSLEADVLCEGEKKPMRIKFYGDQKQKLTIENKEMLDEIVRRTEHAPFAISDIRTGERVKKQPLPFTTSTLQQEAANTLNFSTQKTMRLAQQLYEGIDIKGNGTAGIITYLRTDSTRISEEAKGAAAQFIATQYGAEYVLSDERREKNEGRIQDAHEAIRPTDISLTPTKLKESLSRDQFRLYQLIWRRFTASRMREAVYETTNVKLDAGGYRFTASASKVKFQGFLTVYGDSEEKKEPNTLAKNLSMETKVTLKEFDCKQHFTQPPAHYTEASLVRALEEAGIGRPSTYAPTITTIIARRYVAKESKNLYVTELGEVVNHMMKEAFPSLVDVAFTANMESLLDGVEEGAVKWKTIIRNFYPDLEAAVAAAQKELETVKIEDEVTEEVCEHCGRNMVIKYGPHGRFLACPGFPECKNTKPYLEKIGVTCPLCGGDVVLKKTKKGRRYYGCSNHPECEFMSWPKPSDQRCPKCGSYMVEKGNKLICSEQACGYLTEKTEQSENNE